MDKDSKNVQHTVSRGQTGTANTNRKYLNLAKTGTSTEFTKDSVDGGRHFRITVNRQTSQMSNQRRTAAKCSEMSSSDDE